MLFRHFLIAASVCCAAAITAGCEGDRLNGPRNQGGDASLSVASPNVAVGATVGAPVTYDATKGGTVFSGRDRDGLSYSISFEGGSNGLSAQGGTVSGQPQAPGVTWATIVATDGAGTRASDRFAVVAFKAGLETPALPPAAFHYAVPLPAHFQAAIDGQSVAGTDNSPANNPVTDAGAALGRVLFYDTRLSANDGTSCAGCHNQALGFSDTPAQSVGFAGGLTRRHSPGLANGRFYSRGHFFWDERAATLEDQALTPIQDATEMGMTLENLTAKLEATSYYPALFDAAFGTPEVTSDRVSRAIAQFVRSMVSNDSRYDRAFTAAGTANFGAVFTQQEQEGEQLFRSAGCASCHTTVAQVSDSVHNIGLDAVSTDTGTGRGAFKAPSLRNVAVRPRFMHDGRFTTLEQVVEFFNSGVQPNPDLDPRLRAADGSPKRLGLSAEQKSALVAFLQTLTDSTFLTSARFSNPFGPDSGSSPPPPPPSGGLTAAVTMQGTAYHPAALTVAPGTVVTWTNLDNLDHSASFDSPSVGATPIFISGSQRLTMPRTPGTYHYQCAIHGLAMQGTVTVQ
jgi:cytochrome c peroxidase